MSGALLHPVWILPRPQPPGERHRDLKAVSLRHPLTFSTARTSDPRADPYSRTCLVAEDGDGAEGVGRGIAVLRTLQALQTCCGRLNACAHGFPGGGPTSCPSPAIPSPPA